MLPLTAGAVPADAAAHAPAFLGASTQGVGAGYWHTSGNQIFDSNGSPVRIAGINWYGFETPDEIAHGLWAQDYHTVINDIAALGYNTIRIPFSNQMVETPIVPQNLSFSNNTGGSINADLKGLNALQDLQKIVAAAGQAGLKVILDDHRSEAGESAEQNGLWYTSAYPSSAWVNDWATLAKMFAGNPTVIGFDLRNEPHTPAGDTYAQGATWGSGDPTTDVRLAYQQAGNAILAADPSALIFCEGISEFPDPSASSGFDSTWWGGDLQGVAQFPVTLSSAGACGLLRARLRAQPVPADLVQLLHHGGQPGRRVEQVLGLHLRTRHRAGVGRRVRYRQRVVRRPVLRRRVTRTVVPEPGVLHHRQQVDGLDLLGAQRRGLVRPAGQQLRRDAGQLAEAIAAGGDGVPAARGRKRRSAAPSAPADAVVRVLGHEQLVRRLPGPGDGKQCRGLRDHRLEGELDMAQRPAGQQRLERRVHLVGGGRHGDQRAVQREHQPRKLGLVRLHRLRNGPLQPHRDLLT